MASGQGSTVLLWEDDPGAPPNVNQPIEVCLVEV